MVSLRTTTSASVFSMGALIQLVKEAQLILRHGRKLSFTFTLEHDLSLFKLQVQKTLPDWSGLRQALSLFLLSQIRLLTLPYLACQL